MTEHDSKRYTDLLQILRGFVHGCRPEFAEEPDWPALFRECQIHGITGILAWMILTYDLTEHEGLQQMSRNMTKQTIALYVRRWEDTRKLLEGLRQECIDHVMFKGYVLRDCYPIPELRTYSDMDLSIRLGDRERAHQWMIRNGYRTETDWEPVYSYRKGMEHYEFHTDMMEVDVTDRADYRGYFRSVWDHVEPRQEHTFVPTPEYHFLYLLTHIAKHIHASGAGIRMYLDLAFFIRKYGDDMDWGYVEKELKKLELSAFANTALVAVQQWFQLDIPLTLQPVDSDIMEEFLAFTMEGGVFGHVSRDPGVIALKKNSAEKMPRITTLTRRLLPKAETIERRYTYLQGRHWLLPVAWIHRFFRTRQTWGSHAKEAKVILTSEEEKVLWMRKIQKEIGLG